MSKYYSDLLKRKPQTANSSFWFDSQVLERYRKEHGPWNFVLDEPGIQDRVNFWAWHKGYPVVKKEVLFSKGDRPVEGTVGVHLGDLASMPRSEQEHWHKYEKPSKRGV